MYTVQSFVCEDKKHYNYNKDQIGEIEQLYNNEKDEVRENNYTFHNFKNFEDPEGQNKTQSIQ